MAKEPPVDLKLCAEVAQTCTNFALRKALRAVGKIYDDAMRPVGLRGTQFSLLNSLALHETATINQLAKSLALDPTTLTRGLAPLERDGLVASLAGEDGRERLLRLTADGYERLAKAQKRWEKAQAEVAAKLGASRAQRLGVDLKAAADIEARK